MTGTSRLARSKSSRPKPAWPARRAVARRGISAGAARAEDGPLPARALEVAQAEAGVAGAAGDGEQVDQRVGGAAHGHGDRHRVRAGLAREDSGGGEVL